MDHNFVIHKMYSSPHSYTTDSVIFKANAQSLIYMSRDFCVHYLFYTVNTKTSLGQFQKKELPVKFITAFYKVLILQ